jgi:hypothetical protein
VTLYQDGTRLIRLDNVQTANSEDLGWSVINYGRARAPRPW